MRSAITSAGIGDVADKISLALELKLDIEDAVVERNSRAWEKLRQELD
jgi:hypothetical protein